MPETANSDFPYLNGINLPVYKTGPTMETFNHPDAI